MAKHKRIIFILFVLLSLSSVMFIFWTLRQGKMSKSPSQLSPPTIDLGTTVSKINISSKIDKNSLDIPKTLPVYTISNIPLSTEESSLISKSFGFESDPLVLQDANFGQTYLWSNETGDLRIIPALYIVDYKAIFSGQPKADRFPLDETIISSALNFVSSKKLPTSTSFEFSSLRFIKIFDEGYAVTNKETAEIADVFFTEKISQYPLINTTYEAGTVNVKANKDNRIISVYIDTTATVSRAAEYQVKSYSDLISSLPEAKIVYIENVDKTIYDTPQKISDIVLNKATIAYLQESIRDQVYLQPIFVLEGFATLADSASERKTVLYLPAFKY